VREDPEAPEQPEPTEPPTLRELLERDGCVRVQLVEIERGKKYADTCLSELQLLVRCEW
jgi:hypothetical protein